MKSREQVKALAESEGKVAGGFGEAAQEKPAVDGQQNKELVELLLKETRALVDALNAAKPAKTNDSPKR